MLAAATLMAAPAAAQDAPNTGAISVSTGIDFATSYYFRGIVQETGGLIMQPFLDARISFGAASITAGTWTRLHSLGGTGFAGLSLLAGAVADAVSVRAAVALMPVTLGVAFLLLLLARRLHTAELRS